MAIDDIRPDLARADRAQPRPPSNTQPPAALSVHHCILEMKRSHLARHATAGEDGSAALLPAERLLELRRWLAARGYDAPAVVDEVARILIARRAV